MDFKKIIVAFGILMLVYPYKSSAQDLDKGLDLSFLLGMNFGATTPVPVPNDLKITGYSPRLNPKMGANLVYYFNDRWGIGTGLTLDWKGMNVDTKVTDVHLSIDVPNVGTLTGEVTGRNRTKVNTLYLTQPIYTAFRINPSWQLKGGMYIAESLSEKFEGSVRDVDIVVETPISQEREVPYATLDYSDHVHKLDIGLLAGGEYRLNDHVGFFADFTWGLNPYFSTDVPIRFTMRNVYLSLGATYRIK